MLPNKAFPVTAEDMTSPVTSDNVASVTAEEVDSQVASDNVASVTAEEVASQVASDMVASPVTAEEVVSPATTDAHDPTPYAAYSGIELQAINPNDDPQTTNKQMEVELDLGNNRDEDPLTHCDGIFSCLHRVSPLQGLIYLRLTSGHLYQRHRNTIKNVVIATLIILFIFYLGASFRYRFGDEPSIRLLVVTILVGIGVVYHYVKKFYGEEIYSRHVQPVAQQVHRYHRFIAFSFTVFVSVFVVLFILVDTSLRRPQSLVSVIGIIVFIIVMFFFSKDPRQVTWRPVLWGLLLQLVFGLIVLRTQWGYSAFVWLGDRVTEYLAYSNAGSKFIFGDDFMDHFFAFSVMPVLIFFSASIGILYYLGVIQVLIEKIAFIMQFSLGTSAMESLHAAFNIFIGWGEAITVVRPLLGEMSISELHTVMTNGFATVAGSTLAIYILYGAPANHLISASVMSAPAALAMSKLLYPETRGNRRGKRDTSTSIDRLGTGLIDAASVGAIGAISIVAHILASVVAFISLLAFVNATLQWFGERVGLIPPDYPPLSFELICSYLFWPVVLLMGVAPADCRIVARMVGIKTFINEFIAYEDLGRVRRNRVDYERLNQPGNNITDMWVNSTGVWLTDAAGNLALQGTNITLVGGVISEHSEMIATYALCGFSNFVGLGIMIGALTAVAPSRKNDILAVSLRALVAGSTACYLTACVAGLLGEK